MGRNSGQLVQDAEGRKYIIRNRQSVPGKVMAYRVNDRFVAMRDENEVPIAKMMSCEEYTEWAETVKLIGHVD